MRLCFLIVFAVFASCKMQKGEKKTSNEAAQVRAPLMSCMIRGEIVDVLPPEQGADSLCAQNSCRAKVRVLDVLSCGSSVTLFFNAGDTLEMEFAYTLSDTKHLFFDLKNHLPGLGKGNRFTANATQRMKPGTGEYFVVYSYTKE